jgi:catechol 2,3-dioxygenase-like lactoylglutathione lyase family enzyme
MSRTNRILAIACFAWLFAWPAYAQKSRSFDHVHLAAPEPERAFAWYMEHMGGSPGESPDRVAFGTFSQHSSLPVQLMWQRSADARPSAGSAIDNIGFSFVDVEAKMRALEAAGVKIVMPVHEAGPWKKGVIEDPWGVRIELVQDADLVGFHHVSLSVPDPEASLAWYVAEFGGERTTLKGQASAVKYGAMYLLISRGESVAPSQGSAINHIGWAVHGIDNAAARLKADGVVFSAEPAVALNRYGHRVAFIGGPGGVRIEIVEHTSCPFSVRPDVYDQKPD